MTISELNRLCGKMVVSDTFRAGMLTGNRAELLKDFDLSLEELVGVMAIQAATDKDFYIAFEQIITSFDKSVYD